MANKFNQYEYELLTKCNDYPDEYKVKIDYKNNQAYVVNGQKSWKLGSLEKLFEKMLEYSDIVPVTV